MDDPAYADRYSEPYKEGEKLERMAKQAIDARHVDGKFGVYGGLGAGDQAGAGELGLFFYRTPCVELQASLSYVSKRTGAEDNGFRPYSAFSGFGLGMRTQTPTRLAPFVGAGVSTGFARRELRSNDGLQSHRIADDESFVAAAPEAGLHYWLNPRLRLTSSARYYVSSLGRDDDFWTVGASLSLVTGGASPSPYD